MFGRLNFIFGKVNGISIMPQDSGPPFIHQKAGVLESVASDAMGSMLIKECCLEVML